ncbi:MAG: polymerase subunit delta, partial [Pseudonocardiales bacterium]|nr:polymerase subunit delta [Pseudonocardiales bacterium]
MVIRAAQDVRTAAATVLGPYLESPVDGTVVVVQHAGAAKGKAVLELARRAKALEIGCTKLTRPDERADFVRAEVRSNGGRISGDALAVLMDAVGSDLRELA